MTVHYCACLIAQGHANVDTDVNYASYELAGEEQTRNIPYDHCTSGTCTCACACAYIPRLNCVDVIVNRISGVSSPSFARSGFIVQLNAISSGPVSSSSSFVSKYPLRNRFTVHVCTCLNAHADIDKVVMIHMFVGRNDKERTMLVYHSACACIPAFCVNHSLRYRFVRFPNLRTFRYS